MLLHSLTKALRSPKKIFSNVFFFQYFSDGRKHASGRKVFQVNAKYLREKAKNLIFPHLIFSITKYPFRGSVTHQLRGIAFCMCSYGDITVSLRAILCHISSLCLEE